jgi:peptidyl-prolyl cis-trans isomerase SurA
MKHPIKTALFSLLLACGIMQPDAVQAQSIAVFVNGEAVTTFDIEQRQRIAQRIDRKPISAAQAREEAINDMLKIQEARRIGYRIGDDDVEQQVLKFAQGLRQTIPQFEQNLKGAGIQLSAFRNKTRADMSWITIIQQRMKRGASITNADLDKAAADKAKKTGAKSYEYKLQQVVFVVPAGANGAVVSERQRIAAGSKGQFKGCNNGGFNSFASMPDVAVKEPFNRSSDALSEGANALLAKTPIGGVAGPLTTEQGFELIAVCGKTERVDIAAARTNAENELFGAKSNAESEALLKELRSKAAIERRGR